MAVGRPARAPGPGRFYEPTVLADVDHTMRCMTEETFGPTLPVMAVADADEAVALVNDSPHGPRRGGLRAQRRRGRADRAAARVGAVCVNDAAINYFALEAPMGGPRGVGDRRAPRPGGHPQVLHRAHDPASPRAGAPRREPQMYPYTPALRAPACARLLRLLYRR